MAKPPPSTVDNVVSLAKRRGFVYPCGEIYGGTRSAWDYGPLGVELKENIKRQWWTSMVQTPRRRRRPRLRRSSCRRQTWEASGHVDTFTDPLTECQSCHKRFRADHLQEEYAEKKGIDNPDDVDLDDARLPQLRHPRRLDRAAPVLRPAQDLPRRHRGRVRPALPAPRDRAGHLPQLRQRGDLQPRRSRRSASPRSARASATRSRPATSSSAPASSSRWRWSSSSSRARTRSGTSTGSTSAPAGTSTSASTPTTCATTSTRRRSSRHYSKRHRRHRVPLRLLRLGVGRARGHRQPHRLRPRSSTASTPARTCPTSTRPPTSATCPTSSSRRPASPARLMAFLVDAYTEDEAPNTKGGVDKRTVLRLDPRLAPVKVAVLPLSATPTSRPRPRTSPPSCASNWNVDFDDSGAIGRRYRRQDEIGTPYCVTVDFDTLEDDAVTVRERDTMEQERISLDGITALVRRASSSAADAARPRWHNDRHVVSAAPRGADPAPLPSPCLGLALAAVRRWRGDPGPPAPDHRDVEPATSLRRRRTVDVPTAVKLTEPGTELGFGDMATVAWEPRAGPASRRCDLTVDRSHREGTIKLLRRLDASMRTPRPRRPTSSRDGHERRRHRPRRRRGTALHASTRPTLSIGRSTSAMPSSRARAEPLPKPFDAGAR